MRNVIKLLQDERRETKVKLEQAEDAYFKFKSALEGRKELLRSLEAQIEEIDAAINMLQKASGGPS